MNTPLDRDRPRATDQLHPFVYAALAGLAACLVLAVWIFFSRGGNLELDLYMSARFSSR